MTAQEKAAYQREWRKRKAEHIKAYDLARRERRWRQQRHRRRIDPEKHLLQEVLWGRKHREQRRAYSRAYRAKQIALNPNWAREKMQAWREKHPDYASKAGKRYRLRVAMRKFAVATAATRARYGLVSARERERNPLLGGGG